MKHSCRLSPASLGKKALLQSSRAPPTAPPTAPPGDPLAAITSPCHQFKIAKKSKVLLKILCWSVAAAGTVAEKFSICSPVSRLLKTQTHNLIYFISSAEGSFCIPKGMNCSISKFQFSLHIFVSLRNPSNELSKY